MAKQTINLGTAPTGAGGDTFRSGSAKLQSNDDEIYNYLGDGTNLNKLGTAAFKNVGTGAGNVMEVGAFGLGGNTVLSGLQPYVLPSGAFMFNGDTPNLPFDHANGYGAFGLNLTRGGVGAFLYAPYTGYQNNFIFRTYDYTGVPSYKDHVLRDSRNTSIDPNGFIKNASPIVKVFANKIELNDEAQIQNIVFEKLGVGDYLIKGSTGFAQDGWYIETPKDANGNLLVAVVYEQLENGDISVKTYDYMLNKKGRIVADIETPLDIPESRRIDLRLQELPQPEIEVTDDPEQ